MSEFLLYAVLTDRGAVNLDAAKTTARATAETMTAAALLDAADHLPRTEALDAARAAVTDPPGEQQLAALRGAVGEDLAAQLDAFAESLIGRVADTAGGSGRPVLYVIGGQSTGEDHADAATGWTCLFDPDVPWADPIREVLRLLPRDRVAVTVAGDDDPAERLDSTVLGTLAVVVAARACVEPGDVVDALLAVEPNVDELYARFAAPAIDDIEEAIAPHLTPADAPAAAERR